jgi:hypothetical protein
MDADHFNELVGYTVIAATSVAGDFEGADFDKVVKLDNGMIFEFTSYNYSYSYRPGAAVLARTVPVEQLQKLGKRPDRPLILYKLIVEDEIYDVFRVR